MFGSLFFLFFCVAVVMVGSINVGAFLVFAIRWVFRGCFWLLSISTGFLPTVRFLDALCDICFFCALFAVCVFRCNPDVLDVAYMWVVFPFFRGGFLMGSLALVGPP